MEKTMNNESNQLVPMVEIIPSVVNFGCISPLSTLCSNFWYVLQALFQLLFFMSDAEVSDNKRCSNCSDDNNGTISSEIVRQKPSDNNANDHGDCDEGLTVTELKTVMRNLGILCDSRNYMLKGKLSSHDINALFEEQEPSADEVEEAFQIFDENQDGFINAKDLRKILIKLGFSEVSGEDCRRMIRAFDANGDELIDLDEFARLMTCSFI